MTAQEMEGLETFGVHELSELAQREVLGGGFWETFGRMVGGAVRNTLDVLEDIAEFIGDGYENPRYNGTWQG